MIPRIKELHIEKQLLFRVILMLEMCLLAVGIAGLFGKNTVYEFDAVDATAGIGSYSDWVFGCDQLSNVLVCSYSGNSSHCVSLLSQNVL